MCITDFLTHSSLIWLIGSSKPFYWFYPNFYYSHIVRCIKQQLFILFLLSTDIITFYVLNYYVSAMQQLTEVRIVCHFLI